MTTAKCPMCGEDTAVFGWHKVLAVYSACFRRCPACGFIHAERPSWLAAAYEAPINAMDTGCVARTWTLASATVSTIRIVTRARGPYLDFGGGYGLFVRHLRDLGFDFRWWDPHCRNLLASGHEANPPAEQPYGLITAFEVLEHVVDPLPQLTELLALSDHILFSTELIPPGLQSLADWHYAGLEHGQHVSFYTVRSLRAAATRLGAHLVSDHRSLHLLSRRRFSPLLFRLAVHHRMARALRRGLTRKSLTLPDQVRARDALSNRSNHDTEKPDANVQGHRP